MMSEATLHFIQQRRKALNHHMGSLQSALDDLSGPHKLTDAEVDCLLQTTGEQAVNVLKSQLQAWQAFLGKDKEFMEAQEADASMLTPQISDEARRSKARSKLAAMGGMPALSAFMMPESRLKQHRQALNVTASPAAREMARLRETGSCSAAQPENPSWMVHRNPTDQDPPSRHLQGSAQENVTVSS